MANKDEKKTRRDTITVMIGDQPLIGIFKEFSTGSKGWNANGKAVIDGEKCQVSCNIVVVGSKPDASKKGGK